VACRGARDVSECSDKVGTNSWNGTRWLSIRNWARWLRHHSPAWISSLLLHAVIFLLVLWWGVVPLVPGQGAVEVWLVGGVPGGGGASGSGRVRQSRSLDESVASRARGSQVRSRKGRAPADRSTSPRARRKDSSQESPRKDVTKSPERIAELPKKSQATKQEPPSAATPRVSAPTATRTSHEKRQEPTAATARLLAKAVPGTTPRAPTEEGTKAGSSDRSDRAEERSGIEARAEHDSPDSDSEKTGEGSPQGDQRPGSVVGGGDGGLAARDSSGVQGMGGGFGAFIGRGGGGGRGGDWRGLLLQKIESAKRYPARARRLGIEGIAEVQFRIAGDGTVEGVTVVKSSGFPVLDQASVETIKRAAPFPPIRGTIRVPISYRLRDAR